MAEIKDTLGQTISVGDYVARASYSGLRYARVLRINRRSIVLGVKQEVLTWGSHYPLADTLEKLLSGDYSTPKRYSTYLMPGTTIHGYININNILDNV